MRYIISYDIPDTPRRTKLAKILLDFGNRIQYSVFEAELTEELYLKMRRRINKLIDNKSDSVIIYRLCQGCRDQREQLGSGQVLEDKDVYII